MNVSQLEITRKMNKGGVITHIEQTITMAGMPSQCQRFNTKTSVLIKLLVTELRKKSNNIIYDNSGTSTNCLKRNCTSIR